MLRKKKLLLIMVDPDCSDEQIQKALDELCINNVIAKNTSPVLLNESDFEIEDSTKFPIREEFKRAIKAISKVCGSPKMPEFYRNAILLHMDGVIEQPVTNVLLSITTDEKMWINHMGYTYLSKFINTLPTLP